MCSAWAYPSTKPALTDGGRWWSTAGLAPVDAAEPAGQRDAVQRAGESPASTPEKIAPKTEAPNDPPMERKNVAPEVAAPRSA